MRSMLLSLLLLASPIQALSDDLRRARIEAVASQAADLATTGAGLALGAAEANPLGLLLLPVKAVAYAKIRSLPEHEQPDAWSTYSAFGWGAAANNLCVIGGLLSGGSSTPLCLAIGGGVGWWRWSQSAPEREALRFAYLCESRREKFPDTVCVYDGEVLP